MGAQANYQGTATQANTAQVVGQVSLQSSRLNELGAALHERINELEARLDPISRPLPLSSAAKSDTPKPLDSLVDHARNLRGLGNTIEEAITRLESIRERLEL